MLKVAVAYVLKSYLESFVVRKFRRQKVSWSKVSWSDGQPVGDRFDSTYNQRLTSHRRLRSACKLLTIRRRIFLCDTLRDCHFTESLSSGCPLVFRHIGLSAERHKTWIDVSRSMFSKVAVPSDHESRDHESRPRKLVCTGQSI
jgi:hypothetical protein